MCAWTAGQAAYSHRLPLLLPVCRSLVAQTPAATQVAGQEVAAGSEGNSYPKNSLTQSAHHLLLHGFVNPSLAQPFELIELIRLCGEGPFMRTPTLCWRGGGLHEWGSLWNGLRGRAGQTLLWEAGCGRPDSRPSKSSGLRCG